MKKFLVGLVAGLALIAAVGCDDSPKSAVGEAAKGDQSGSTVEASQAAQPNRGNVQAPPKGDSGGE
jgi:hypothetical protein